jgi:hypothetical protein
MWPWRLATKKDGDDLSWIMVNNYMINVCIYIWDYMAMDQYLLIPFLGG